MIKWVPITSHLHVQFSTKVTMFCDGRTIHVSIVSVVYSTGTIVWWHSCYKDSGPNMFIATMA